jgi:hypothetical protein
VSAAVQIGGGVLLLTDKFRRLASLALVVSVVPTTVIRLRFWEESDPDIRDHQKTHLLKNVGLLVGLVVVGSNSGKATSAGRRLPGAGAVLALERAVDNDRVHNAVRQSKAALTHVAQEGSSTLADRIDTDTLQQLVASGSNVAHRLPSTLPGNLKQAGEAAWTAVHDPGASAPHTAHQAGSALGTVVSQVEPLAERLVGAGAEAIRPVVSRAADRATDALSRLADRSAR